MIYVSLTGACIIVNFFKFCKVILFIGFIPHNLVFPVLLKFVHPKDFPWKYAYKLRRKNVLGVSFKHKPSKKDMVYQYTAVQWKPMKGKGKGKGKGEEREEKEADRQKRNMNGQLIVYISISLNIKYIVPLAQLIIYKRGGPAICDVDSFHL